MGLPVSITICTASALNCGLNRRRCSAMDRSSQSRGPVQDPWYTPVPFRPFRECLAHYVLSVSEGRLADHNQQRLASITRIVPELAGRTPQLPDPTRSDPDV